MARSTSSPVATPGSAADAAPGRSLALNLLISLRPGQWTKNLVIFAGLLFGLRLFDPIAFGTSGLVAAVRIGWPFAIVAMAYVALQLAYSAALKHIVILDVLTIAI